MGLCWYDSYSRADVPLSGTSDIVPRGRMLSNAADSGQEIGTVGIKVALSSWISCDYRSGKVNRSMPDELANCPSGPYSL